MLYRAISIAPQVKSMTSCKNSSEIIQILHKVTHVLDKLYYVFDAVLLELMATDCLNKRHSRCLF